MVVIEMNPRVSRSSALASKATGFAIAKVAAKLAVGYTLDELSNEITGGAIPASFEPSIDYVVTKIPRFAFEKFPQTDTQLSTQMKSVGEVMAMGRTWQESLQKAIRGLEIDRSGLSPIIDSLTTETRAQLCHELQTPSPQRLWYLADAFRLGLSQAEIFQLSHIDPWYLAQIEELVQYAEQVKQLSLAQLDGQNYINSNAQLDGQKLYQLKRKGFADSQLAGLLDVSEEQVRQHRQQLNIRPVYKRVDTCAAEFAATSAYLYSTYEEECEAKPSDRQKIMILGGGPNRIGQGIEFDYCCVQAAMAVREAGYEAIMVNSNPETVSTDYDISDRLYFEPVTLEDVLEIIQLEQPDGVIVQYGGQTPLKLAKALANAKVPIIGTISDAIDRAEDRQRFQQLVDKLGLKQPPNRLAHSADQGIELAAEIGYPLVVRPSYVLGGRAMEIVYNETELKRYMKEAVQVSFQAPVLLDRFLDHAIEVDMDVVSDGKQVVVGGIMQHIEQAGVHSGDSACAIPPFSLSSTIQDELRLQGEKLALELGVVGLMNIQFAIQGETVYLLEVNPRASRTVPFVSKAIGLSMAKIATHAMLGTSLAKQGFTQEIQPPGYFVKEAVFPFNKFPGVDPILGPEMRSTGETMGVGSSFAEAAGKAQLAAGVALPAKGQAFLSVRDSDKEGVINVAQQLLAIGFSLVATDGTAATLKAAGLAVTAVNKVLQGRPHIVDLIKSGEVHYIVNTTEGAQAIADSYTIRRTALQYKIAYTTTLAGALAAIQAMQYKQGIQVRKLQELHP
jgi:carbamoyl-phosphate synthase large subunit